MSNQMIRRYQLSAGSENISSRQVAIPKRGVSGISGTRKGRSACGYLRRMIKTAEQTITNAKRVPMLTNPERILSGNTAAKALTKTPVKMVDFQGVRNR